VVPDAARFPHRPSAASAIRQSGLTERDANIRDREWNLNWGA
jgi:hypothetical protein